MTATNIATPAARATDPATSHMAADAATASGLRQSHIQQLEVVLCMYPDGRTSAEIAHIVADKFPDLNRHEVARRLADGMGISFDNVPAGELRVAAGEPVRNVRKCAVSGRSCLVWYPTAALLASYGKGVQ